MSRTRTFTLVELIMVVAMIAMLASMAVPRLGGLQRQAERVTMQQDTAVLQNAINYYGAEHVGRFPAEPSDTITAQLTGYTDRSGNASQVRTPAHVYGPYLREIPGCPFGQHTSPSALKISKATPPLPGLPGTEGWVYNPMSGQVLPNHTFGQSHAAFAIEATQVEQALEAEAPGK